MTDCTAPVASDVVLSLAPGMQFGNPSVASRMYFGLVSVRPCRYAPPLVSAVRVGVRPPGPTPTIALAIAIALFGAIPTETPALTPQALSFGLGKNLRPQRMLPSVCITTWLMAS